jgi:two-component system, NarL family, response regulator DesR
LHSIERMPSMLTPKIIFAGNYNSQNNNLISFVSSTEDVIISGIFDSYDTMIAQYTKHNPFVIFIDAYLEGITGFEAARFIREQNENIKLIIVSERFTPEFEDLALELRLDGYLPKNLSAPVFVSALQSILDNGSYFHRAAQLR